VQETVKIKVDFETLTKLKHQVINARNIVFAERLNVAGTPDTFVKFVATPDNPKILGFGMISDSYLDVILRKSVIGDIGELTEIKNIALISKTELTSVTMYGDPTRYRLNGNPNFPTIMGAATDFDPGNPALRLAVVDGREAIDSEQMTEFFCKLYGYGKIVNYSEFNALIQGFGLTETSTQKRYRVQLRRKMRYEEKQRAAQEIVSRLDPAKAAMAFRFLERLEIAGAGNSIKLVVPKRYHFANSSQRRLAKH
jgi:hypothetical protein